MAKVAPYYISLGAGHNQRPLIEAARKRGYRVAGVDADLNAEGMRYCDLRLQESILNYRKVHVKLMMSILDADVVGGFCASYGAALYSWAFLAERYGLPGLSRTQTEALLDKATVRRRLDAEVFSNEIFAQPRFLAIEQKLKREQLDTIGYPQIIKSRFGASKKSIMRSESYMETKRALSKTRLSDAGLSPREILIEQQVLGDEITVVGFVEDFKYHLVLVTDKITSSQPPFIELEHVFPSKYFDDHEKIEKMHQEVVGLLDISTTPLVSEWKVRNGRYQLIELSPQIPGEYIPGFMIPNVLKYDYFDNLVALTTGEPIDPPPTPKRRKKVSVKYWPKRISPESWDEHRKQAEFARILNQNPNTPPQSNADRFGVMGFVG